jgi:hypothetical protein
VAWRGALEGFLLDRLAVKLLTTNLLISVRYYGGVKQRSRFCKRFLWRNLLLGKDLKVRIQKVD